MEVRLCGGDVMWRRCNVEVISCRDDSGDVIWR